MGVELGMHRASMTGCSCASLSAPLFQPCVNKDVICSTGDAPCLGSAGEHHACPSLPELLLSLQQLGHLTGISGGPWSMVLCVRSGTRTLPYGACGREGGSVVLSMWYVE